MSTALTTFSLTLSWRYLLSLPIPAFPPPFQSEVLNNLNQFLGGRLRRKQLLLGCASPKLLTQLRFHSPRVQTYTHCILPTPLLQGNVYALGDTIDGSFACPVAVPSTKTIVTYATHSGRHQSENTGSRETRD